MQERISKVMGWKGVYESLDEKEQFFSSSASCDINQVKLTSVSNSRIYTKAVSDDTSSMFIPTAGDQSVSIVNGKRFEWGVNSVGLYAPAGERIGYAGTRSVLIMDINHARMQQTLSAMLQRPISLTEQLKNPQGLAMEHHGINFAKAFTHLGAQIDSFGGHSQALNYSGIDDQFYRLAALWMFPEFLLKDESKTPQDLKPGIARAKEYVYAHLDKRIGLTDLEIASGLSRRALQYGFMKCFGKTPLEWVRDERLNLAHIYLQSAHANESITQIAMQFGFYSSSKFTSYYKQKFGVPPSQTHAKKD
jgi:AraC-like DNA-binding protein